MGYKVAVVGATGNVGREMLNILEEREFPVDEVHAIASRRSLGVEVSFGDRVLKCKDLEQFDFSTVDFVLMSAGSEVSKAWSPRIGAAGAIVIDNSSCWRYDPEVPLIVPEVNAPALETYMKQNTRRNIIANPNCSTAQLVVALKPLHDAARIRRVVVSTYQSVSGAGKEAMDELWNQTKGIFVTDPPTPRKFTKQIAFNVIPHIDVFMDSGDTKEEWKMVAETKKILDPKIKLTATCVRVPVLVGQVPDLPARVAEVLADVRLVARQDRHREPAAGHHQRIGVVLGRHARHHDRLLEAHLGDPMAREGSRDAVVVRTDHLDTLDHLAEAALEDGIDHAPIVPDGRCAVSSCGP